MKHVVTGASFRQTILVTGFGSFPGARKNPTLAILAQLGRHRGRLARLGIDVRLCVLPVVYATVGPAQRGAIDAARPDAVLHLGLASRRRHLSIELRAVNRANPLRPDAARQRPTSPALVPFGPSALPSTYPARQILALLRRDGLDARLSIDAGAYVCNATLYATLTGPVAQAGFLHIPKLRRSSQPLGRPGKPRPTKDAVTRGVLAAIMLMARARPSSVAAASPKARSTDAASVDRSGHEPAPAGDRRAA